MLAGYLYRWDACFFSMCHFFSASPYTACFKKSFYHFFTLRLIFIFYFQASQVKTSLQFYVNKSHFLVLRGAACFMKKNKKCIFCNYMFNQKHVKVSVLCIRSYWHSCENAVWKKFRQILQMTRIMKFGFFHFPTGHVQNAMKKIFVKSTTDCMHCN